MYHTTDTHTTHRHTPHAHAPHKYHTTHTKSEAYSAETKCSTWKTGSPLPLAGPLQGLAQRVAPGTPKGGHSSQSSRSPVGLRDLLWQTHVLQPGHGSHKGAAWRWPLGYGRESGGRGCGDSKKWPYLLNTCSLTWPQKGAEHFKVQVPKEMESIYRWHKWLVFILKSSLYYLLNPLLSFRGFAGCVT